MAASPETDALLSNGYVNSSPSPPPSTVLLPAQENSTLTTGAPWEPAQLDHTTPTSPPPPEQDTVERSDSGEFPPPKDFEDLAPSLPPVAAPPSASPALETASPEKPASPPSCPLGAPLEVLPDGVTASVGSSPPHPKIGEAPSKAEDAPRPLSPPPPPPPPAKTSPRAALDAYTTKAVAMASPEAASPPPASESDSHRAPAQLTPPLGNVPERLALQQHPEPVDPEISPQVCEKSEPAEPLPPQAGSMYVTLDEEVVDVVSSEAAGSPPALEATDGERETAPDVPPSQESRAEGALPEQQPRSPRSDVAPPCQNSEPAMLLQQPPPSAKSESTYCLLEAALNEETAVVSEEAAPALDGAGEEAALESPSEGPIQEQMQISSSSPQMEAEPCSPDMAPPGFESKAAMVSEETAPVRDGVGEESLSEGPLQEQKQVSPSSSQMEAEPRSPDMAPPGFENFKSKWLPQPLLTDTACMVPEATAGSPPALETMDVGMKISPGQPPSSKSAEDCPGSPDMQPLGFENISPGQPPSSKSAEDCPGSPDLPPPGFENISPGQPPSSKIAEDCPGSPDMPPPGFENFKTLWLPQPPPSPEATYLPDVATTKEELVEKACSVPMLDTMDMQTNTARSLSSALESGAGGLLQVPEPSSPSPRMQSFPCSLNIAPPRYETILPQLQIPLPIAPTLHISQDSAATGALCLTSENSPQPSPIMDAMNDTPELPTSSESEAREPMQQEPSRLPFCSVQGINCSREIVSSGSECSESLADAVIPTVTVEAVGHPLTVAEVKEEAKVDILPPPLENGCDRPLPCLEPKASSPEVQAALRSPGITPTSFENLESSQQTHPHLAERTDSPSHLTVTECVTVKSDKTAQSVPPLLATDTDLESAPILQSPLKSEETSLPHPPHQASSPSGKDVPGSPDTAPSGYEILGSSEELPPRPPLCPNFELGQMVCGGCRELIAYPRGATHVQCFGCSTINLVLEAHQVGNVYCGQCKTLLMYPFGAPAVRCSSCYFVTEIGEDTIRPQMSDEQGASPPPQELGQA